MKSNNLKLESRAIFDLIRPVALVLDLGCGEGELMYELAERKSCKVQGVDIDEKSIYKCVARGLSVLHGDIDSGLIDYGDDSFDYVILNQSFQQVKDPDHVLQQSLRIGKKVIVSFPNFACLPARCQMFFKGRTPVTPSLPYEWYNTPNLHFLSIADFIEYCGKRSFRIVKAVYTGNKQKVKLLPNLFAVTGIFVLSKRD